MPKVELPHTTFCGREFGHSRWVRHLGSCDICKVEWEKYKTSERQAAIDKWSEKCACGCGRDAPYGKEYYRGHFTWTKEAKARQSERMKANNPMFSDDAKKKISAFWTGRKRPNQCGEDNVSKTIEVRKKISENNSMKNAEHRASQKAGCLTPKERKRRSLLLKKINLLADPECLERRVATYCKRLSEGKYQIKGKWKTGWFEKKDGTKEWYDSSYEKKRMEQYEELGIEWTKKHGIRIPYVNANGRNTYYVPDFLIKEGVQSVLEEIKGWMTDAVEMKAQCAIDFCKSSGMKYRLLLGEKMALVPELSLEDVS